MIQNLKPGRAGAALKIEGDYAAGLANDDSTRFVGSAAGLYAMSQSLFGLSAGGMTGALAFETTLPIAHSLPSGAKADSRLGVGFSVYMGGTF